MPVRLRKPADLPESGWDAWVALPAAGTPRLDAARRRAAPLERAFPLIAEAWLELGRRLSAEPSAILAHAPACAGTISDLGEMLAWTKLVDEWAAGTETILAVCGDPWLFRHLAGRPGVEAGSAPPLLPVAARLTLRGLAARGKAALTAAAAALKCRGKAATVPKGVAALLVYGNPASRADGFDAYFPTLLAEAPGLVRILHTDCPPARADELGAGLHGWGSPVYALSLPFRRWRPRSDDWLVRRAAAREAGTGTPAMLAWQRHCQRRFLATVRPRAVAWPWENHAWERDFVRAARALGVHTIGSQHASLGSLELNHADTAALPDVIACPGPAAKRRLAAWGLPEDRLWVGGAWRFPSLPPLAHDASGPFFLALPAEPRVAAQMVAAAAATGRRFLVREHPMTPVGFKETARLARSPGPLPQCGALAGVVYAANSVGLEAALGGLPVLRFLTDGVLANDVLPPGIEVAAADAAGLAAALDAMRPVACRRDDVFAEVDREGWRRLLA